MRWGRLRIYFLMVLIIPIIACHSVQRNRSTLYHFSILDLQEDLSVSIDSLGMVIGSFIPHLAVDRHGNIYLEDQRQAKVHILSSSGRYLYSLGRRGHGPGEFENIANIQCYKDTLYVLESYPARLSKFSLDKRQLMRTESFPDIKIGKYPLGFPHLIYPLSNGYYEIIFVSAISLNKPIGSFSIMNHKLIPIDTVVRQFLPSHILVYVDKGGEGIIPFSYGGNLVPGILAALGPNGLLYEADTDSMHIRIFNRSGSEIKDISILYSPPSLTHADIDSLAESISPNIRSFFYKALKQNNVIIPSHWPTIQKLLIDDKSQCWVELVNPGKPKQTWWVFDTDGKPKWKFQLSRNVKLYVVRNHEAYGIWSKKGEYPQIVRYRVEGM